MTAFEWVLGHSSQKDGQSQPNERSYGVRIDCGKGTGSTTAAALYLKRSRRRHLVPIYDLSTHSTSSAASIIFANASSGHGDPGSLVLQAGTRIAVVTGGAESVSGVALRICSADCAT
jgi:hypothetical protein